MSAKDFHSLINVSFAEVRILFFANYWDLSGLNYDESVGVFFLLNISLKKQILLKERILLIGKFLKKIYFRF